MNRKYMDFNPRNAYPAGERIRYECVICGSSLQSMPQHAVACSCNNIIVDVDAGRVAVKDTSKMRIYEIEDN